MCSSIFSIIFLINLNGMELRLLYVPKAMCFGLPFILDVFNDNLILDLKIVGLGEKLLSYDE
jgi:hypothetical protein